MDDFRDKIERLDLALFQHIESQSTKSDQTSLLMLELAFRQTCQEFVYLEIGSHLGGSLQSLVADPQCARIVSIDPRPPFQPDERGQNCIYPENSTARMLQLLRAIPGADIQKIHTLDAGTDTIPPADIPYPPDFCFVDGEHTDAAVLRDARFCLQVMKENGCIVFHDANIIYRGVDQFVKELAEAGRGFRAYVLPESVFVIELGNCRLNECAVIRPLLVNNYKGYLWSLMTNDQFRQIVRRPVIQKLLKAEACWERCREAIKSRRVCAIIKRRIMRWFS